MKKLNFLKWFPHLNSWLNALILFLFMAGLFSTIVRNPALRLYLAKFSNQPELLTVLAIFLLILPIPAIAFLHHFILSPLILVIPGEKKHKASGFFPRLISWRESLYSWLVLVLSTLTATVICTPLLSLFQLNYNQIFNATQINNRLTIIFALIWLISAAIFYEIEYLFKCRLVFGNGVSDEPIITNLPHANQTQVETIASQKTLTDIQTTAQTPTTESNVNKPLHKSNNLPSQIFTLILIPLVALWIYSFAKLPEVRQTISANVPVASPSPVATQKPKPKDNYDQAIKKATRAAKLAQLAQSEQEWKLVVISWDEAIALLKTVPYTSPNYAISQQRIIQYQAHRDFAQQYTEDSN